MASPYLNSENPFLESGVSFKGTQKGRIHSMGAGVDLNKRICSNFYGLGFSIIAMLLPPVTTVPETPSKPA